MILNSCNFNPSLDFEDVVDRENDFFEENHGLKVRKKFVAT